jgi:hypothetical protein
MLQLKFFNKKTSEKIQKNKMQRFRPVQTLRQQVQRGYFAPSSYKKKSNPSVQLNFKANGQEYPI